MHRHVVFVMAVGAFCGGIALATFAAPQAAVVLWGMFALGLLGLVARPRLALLGLAGVLGLAVFLGFWRGTMAWRWAHALPVPDGTRVTLTGTVLRAPVEKDFTLRAPVAVRRCVRDDGDPCSHVRRVMVRVPGDAAAFALRAPVRFTCTLHQVRAFTPDFDYRMFLAAKGVRMRCSPQQVERAAFLSRADRALWLLAQGRLALERRVAQLVPQPQAALAMGLLFGGDERLSEVWQADFSTVGLTHIVAVSGYNVTLIVHALLWAGILVGLWRRQALWVAIAGVVVFVLMIGAPSPAVRAGVTGVLLLLLLYAGRLGSALPALLFSAALMLAWNPLLLRYDIGFQLSFLASLGIVTFYPLLERAMHAHGGAVGLREIVLVTVSAQVFVVPLLLYHFHAFATFGLLANVLVLPVIPLAMALTVAMLALSVVSMTVALWIGWALAVVLGWVFVVVDALAAVPFARVMWEAMPAWYLAVWYAVAGGILAAVARWHRAPCRHNEQM